MICSNGWRKRLALRESRKVVSSANSWKYREPLQSLAARYADSSPNFADLCLIRLSELNPKMPILTIDKDFLIYRRNGKESIPVIMPPNS